jgi:hypothetical protein
VGRGFVWSRPLQTEGFEIDPLPAEDAALGWPERQRRLLRAELLDDYRLVFENED